MFDPKSRYDAIANAQRTVTDDEGRTRLVNYKRRRFLPAPDGMMTLLEHPVVQGDRLDNIAARYAGDPLQFWRICDANRVLRPDDLTADVGATIRVALSGTGGS